MSISKSSTGGSANTAGVSYEALVGAWYAVRILAEDESPPLRLPVGTRFTTIRCQSGESVDDLLIGTSEGGWLFVQAKRSIVLGETETSVFGSVVEQFVQQIVARGVSAAEGKAEWDRPIDPEKDRLILCCGPDSSSPIKTDLRNVLNRFRELGNESQLESVARNKKELRALRITVDLARRSWSRIRGSAPTNGDIAGVLRALWVDVRAVEEDQPDEDNALQMIQVAIVADSEDIRKTWTTLYETCNHFAKERSGGDAATMRQILARHKIRLRSPRVYIDDIVKLKQATKRMLEYLHGFACISTGGEGDPIRVSRECISPLVAAARTGSVLVTGEPGAGKSGALHDLGVQIQSEKCDVVVLSIDQFEGFADTEMANQLGLAHGLVEVLANWIGEGPAFLVLDAFDAARKARGPQNLHALLVNVMKNAPRWHAVVSVRTFDLRYNLDLQGCFRGVPPDSEYTRDEFGKVRHFNIPQFTDVERQQISEISPALFAAAKRIERTMEDAAWLPFNLRLLGSIADEPEVSEIRTQLDLLDLYWKARVASGENGVGYISLLRRVVTDLVKTRSIEWQVSTQGDEEKRWIRELVSAGVLTEWRPGGLESLSFGHHILTDYAIARLKFRNLDEAVRALLESEPDLLIAFRPSLLFEYQRLWDSNNDRTDFWQRAFEFQRASARAIGRLLAPTVAAHRFGTVGDVDALLSELPEREAADSNAASDLLRHMIGAAVISNEDIGPLVGPNAAEWSLLSERIAERLSTTVAYTLRFLLHHLSESISLLTPEQLGSVGRASRLLLDRVIDSQDVNMLEMAIRLVCKTYSSDASAAELILRRLLGDEEIADRGHKILPAMAQEVKSIIAISPRFAVEIYKAAYGHRERRDDPTSMGDSHIIALSSTIRQDYEMSLYNLAHAFGDLIDRDAEAGTRVIALAIASHERAEARFVSEETESDEFSIFGQRARMRSDGSVMWFDRRYPSRDGSSEMLASWESYVCSIPERADGDSILRTVISVLAADCHLAFLWNRLLRCVASNPEWFGGRLKELLFEPVILRNPDTSTVAGKAIEAAFPYLSHDDRVNIEQAILSLVRSPDEETREREERLGRRLISKVPPELVCTEEARAMIAGLREHDGSDPRKRTFVHGLGWKGREEQESSCADDSSPNGRLQELAKPLVSFHGTFLNETPSSQEVEEIRPALECLRAALGSPEMANVDLSVRGICRGAMFEACADIARCETLAEHVEIASLVQDLLILAASDDCPDVSEVDSHGEDDTPSWRTPAPRVDAAQGLPRLARWSVVADPRVLETIEKLSRDPVPVVRVHIVQQATILRTIDEDLMWRIVKRVAREEDDRFVLETLVQGPLRVLMRRDYDCAIAILLSIHERSMEILHANQLRGACMGVILRHFLYEDRLECEQFVDRVVGNLGSYHPEISRIVDAVRGVITVGTAAGPAHLERARDRMHDLLERIAVGVSREVVGWRGRAREEQESLVPFVWIADSMAFEISLACGGADGDEKAQRPGPDDLAGFLDRTEGTIEALITIGEPKVAYHLIGGLMALIAVAPDRVIVHIRNAVLMARAHGVTGESLAADKVVAIVERYLAEYRYLLRTNPACRDALLDLLDAFVEAGWRSAMALTYRLHEMYR